MTHSVCTVQFHIYWLSTLVAYFPIIKTKIEKSREERHTVKETRRDKVVETSSLQYRLPTCQGNCSEKWAIVIPATKQDTLCHLTVWNDGLMQAKCDEVAPMKRFLKHIEELSHLREV